MLRLFGYGSRFYGNIYGCICLPFGRNMNPPFARLPTTVVRLLDLQGRKDYDDMLEDTTRYF